MTVHTAVAADQPALPSECWCCGTLDDPARLVRLGNHPEVGVCTRCARSISKWGAEIEDHSRTGVAVRARDRFRGLRRAVVRRGWHQRPLVGRAVRWIGRHTP
jgi:hypothetical protein